MRPVCVLLCSAVLLHSQTTEAPAVDPQKVALVRQIVATAEYEQIRRRLLTGILPQQLAAMRANSAYPPGYVDELQKKLTERISAMDPVDVVAPVYSEHFSVEELQQILAFRTSAVGRKLASLQPEMNSAIVRQASLQTLQITAAVESQVASEHPEWLQRIQDAQKAGANDQAVLRVGGDVSAPMLLAKTEPQYTPEALQAKKEGSVLVSLVVGTDGVPRDVRVLRSLGSGLDEKAIEAVSSWRFKPGMRAGLPVATRANVEVNFRLLQKPPQ